MTTILGHSTREILRIAARLRVDARRDRESQATATALRTPARRSLTLEPEAQSHETLICTIVREWHPELLDLFGVGPIVAATVLCAWSHPGRCRSDAAFRDSRRRRSHPRLVRANVRHRFNRCGDRQPSRALHTIGLSRLRHDPSPAPTPNAAAPGKDRPRDQTVPQALHRPTALPDTPGPDPKPPLTSIGASMFSGLAQAPAPPPMGPACRNFCLTRSPPPGTRTRHPTNAGG